MMKNRVLLINLPVSSNNTKKGMRYFNSMPPLGLLYIGAYLKSKGLNYNFIDFAVTNITKEQFILYLKSISPQIIGISTYNESWEAQKVFTKLIKEIVPNAIIVAGGAFATFCYEDMFNEKLVKYVIRGEGEVAFYDLCNFILNNEGDIEKISGLVYQNTQGDLNVNMMLRNKDLNKLPFPDRTVIDPRLYNINYTISTARGCPGKCIFCSSKAFWGKSIYVRSVDSIFDEVMDIYTNHNSNTIYFADDTFTLNKTRAIEFCKKIKKTKIEFFFGFESRADVIDEEFIKILSSAGFCKIQIGLESADNEILRKIKKNVTIEQIENAIRLAAKYNMKISVSFIVGHAYDTEMTIQKTIDFVKHIQENYNAHVMGSINTPFPGTEQFIKADELGIAIHSTNWDQFRLSNPIISTNNFTSEKLKEYYFMITEICQNNK